MARFKIRKEVVVFLLCAVLVVLGWSFINGIIFPSENGPETVQEVMITSLESEEDAERIQAETVYNLTGTVWNGTPDYSSGYFDRFEEAIKAAETEEDMEKAYMAFMKRQKIPVPNAVITLRFWSESVKTVSDAQGNYWFKGLPRGEYELTAEAPLTPPSLNKNKRKSIESKKFNVYASDCKIDLEMKGHAIILRGRIIDKQGSPIRGAEVRGEPRPLPETSELTPPTLHAVSDKRGAYEFHLHNPLHIHELMGYLAGGDPTNHGMYSFYIEVHAEAPGFTQGRDNAPRVPYISPEQVTAARRLGTIMDQILIKIRKERRWTEKEGLPLPAGHENVITGVDIIMEKAEGISQ